MEDKNETAIYSIAQIVQFTGLTDRTIRNYISNGILLGEKINGLWQFTSEQVDAFIRHPSVRPSIMAKNNAPVYDFLMNPSEDDHRCCMVLDIPGVDKQEITNYFCNAICAGDFHDFQFSFDGLNKTSRVILRGKTEEVLQLVNGYHAK